MTEDDIIRMAREARLAEPYHPFNPWGASQEALERFAKLVAAYEREACAKVCADMWTGYGDLGAICAAAIRARSN